jgi:hypothetical protein
VGQSDHTGAPELELDPLIVILPGGVTPGTGPVFDGEALGRALELRWTFGTVPVYGTARERHDHLTDAHEIARQLVDAVHRPDSPTPVISPLTPAQEYFRTRTGLLDDGAYLAQTARLLAGALAELSDAAIAGSDIERLCRAMDRHLVDLGATRALQPAQPALAHDRPESKVSDEQRWMRRWIVAHQLHALFNVSAAAWISSATQASAGGDPAMAAHRLSTACTYVEAFSPSRALALAVPADFYNTVLRATMTPPLTSTPLSGRMHVEYRAYRDAVAALLSEASAPVADLARTEPTLALAREHLLEADLADAERHISLIEPIVGQSKSIVQTARSQGNAVSALRSIRASRARAATPYLRFGNPGAEGAPAPAAGE